MHLWIALPFGVIDLSDQHDEALRIRGFGTVVLYQRENRSLAYGLSHACDLEVQSPANQSWSRVGLTSDVQSASAEARPMVAADCGEHLAWLTFFRPKVVLAHRKVVAYGQRRDDVHNEAFCAVLEKTLETVKIGQLPEATEMNTVYYLLGQWRAGHAPRHLREAYP